MDVIVATTCQWVLYRIIVILVLSGSILFTRHDHLMIELDTIIALATVTCVLEANSYELHPMNERVFNDFIDDK